MKTLITTIDTLTEGLGRLASVTLILLIALVLFDTLNRYLFSGGSIALQELEWHLHDLIFLFGIAFALKYNAHVRVDMFYERYPKKIKAWVNVAGVLFLIIPFSVFIFYTGMGFAYEAYGYSEMSPNPGGLGYRFIIKSFMSVAFAFVVIQAVSELLKSIQILKENQNETTH